MTTAQSVRRCLIRAATGFALLFVALPSFAQQQPWMNSQLSPDVRADLILKELTLDEKIDLLHGNGMRGVNKPRPNRICPRCRTARNSHDSNERCCLRRSQQRRKRPLFHRASLEFGCRGQLGHASRLRVRRSHRHRPRTPRPGATT